MVSGNNINKQKVFIFQKERITGFQQIALIYSFLVYGLLNVFNYGLIWRAAFYGILLFFALGSIIAKWRYTPIHIRLLSTALIVIGAAIYPLTDTFLLLLLSACGACLIGIPLKKIIKTGYRTQIVFFVAIVVLSMFGLNKSNNLMPIDSGRGYRYALGFSHPNTAASYFLFTIMLYFSSSKNQKIPNFLIVGVLSILIFALTNSKTILLFDILFFIIIIFYRYIVLPKKIVAGCALLFPLLLIISHVFCIYYNSSWINEMLSGRLWYGMEAIKTGVSLFGHEIEYPVDIMYIDLVYNYGISLTLFYFFIFTIPFLFLAKRFNNKYRTLFSLYGVLILLYSLSETYALNLLTPLSILFFYFVYNEKPQFDLPEDCCYQNIENSQLVKLWKAIFQ